MSKEMDFFIYLLEHYAAAKGLSAGDVLDRWNELGLTNFFYEMYELYHSEALENAFEDIDRRMQEAMQTAAQ